MRPLVEVLTSTTAWFREKGIPSARLDAELLISHLLGLERIQLYLNFDRPLSSYELDRLRPLVRRRGDREPLAWVLGTKEFYGRDFTVGPGVLVPRPDTETLIEAALEWLPAADSPAGGAPGVTPMAAEPTFLADIGSGTGCIGLTLALERPGIRVFAVDRADEALAATRANIVRHGLDKRVAVLRGDLLAAIPPHRLLDWVVSNPPYIPSAELASLAPEVRDHEPRGALDGGADGLDVYRQLVPAAVARARAGVLLEVGAGQASAVAGMLQAAGLPEVRIWKDLGGIERVVGGRR